MTAPTINKTDEVLAQVLTKALEVAEKTGQFVIEQAPDVVQQLILYYTVLYWAYIAFGLLVLAVGMTLSVRSFKSALARAEKHDYKDADDFGQFWFGMLAGVVSSVAFLFLFINNISAALKITLAPKVWLIEYAANLIR